MSTTEVKRKRKWDVDDSGQPTTPPSAATTPESSQPPISRTPSIPDLLNMVKQNVATPASHPPGVAGMTGTVVKLLEDVVVVKNTETKTDGTIQHIGDIDINDIKNKYLLTKGATQIDIKEKTGADIITRGKYYPDRNLATEKEPPLYLHIVAQSEEALEKAIEEVKALMQQSLVLIQTRERQAPTPAPVTPTFNNHVQRVYHTDKISVDMEGERGFNVRAKIVGPQGAYVKHIQHTTGSRIQLKGRGSGYVEHETGRESDEPLHVFISSQTENGLAAAKDLVHDLIKTVKADYVKWKENKPAPVLYPNKTYSVIHHQAHPNQNYHPHSHNQYNPANNSHPNSASPSPYPVTPSDSHARPPPPSQPAMPGANIGQDAYIQYYNYYQYIISQSDPATAQYYSSYLQQLIATNPGLAAAAKAVTAQSASQTPSQTANPGTSTQAPNTKPKLDTPSASEPTTKKPRTEGVNYHQVPPPALLYGNSTASEFKEVR